MANSGNAVANGMKVFLVVSLVGFIASILIPIFLPFLKTGLTNMKDNITTAGINTTMDTVISLCDYSVLFFAVGTALSLVVGALAGVWVAIRGIGGK